ncbi:hypothetical protein AC1031_021921 [Aphanomyces cochlioides]|nr:hypothetical protein AC1031_021921 [Aphanomyces cochlioides]
MGKQQQWNQRHRATKHHQCILTAADMAKCTSALRFRHNQDTKSRHDNKNHLHRHAFNWIQQRGAFHKAVHGQEDTDRDRQPGKSSISNRNLEHASRCQRYGDPLPGTQSFLQDDDSQEDAQNGIHEESKARFDNEIVGHSPEECEPHTNDGGRGNNIVAKDFWLDCRLAKTLPLDSPDEEGKDKDERPDDSVTGHLQRGNVFQLLKVDGVDAIDDKGQASAQDANVGTHCPLEECTLGSETTLNVSRRLPPASGVDITDVALVPRLD